MRAFGRCDSARDRAVVGLLFYIDIPGIRALAEDVWLVPGRGYVCLVTANGAGMGGGCVTLRKAVRSGVSTGLPTGVTIEVPDGVTAVEARLHWHGPWRRYAVADGLARLRGLGLPVARRPLDQPRR